MRQFNILWLMVCILSGCSYDPPSGIKPITHFDAKAYEGTWYEIARLDHRFERGLSCVSATYSSDDKGGIKVINRGYNEKKAKWSEAIGRAYFVKGNEIGLLKVSFFGPFYGAYVIFYLDQDHAYITSNTKDYLWFLSHIRTVKPASLA